MALSRAHISAKATYVLKIVRNAPLLATQRWLCYNQVTSLLHVVHCSAASHGGRCCFMSQRCNVMLHALNTFRESALEAS